MQPLMQWKTNECSNCECVFVALSIQHVLCMRHIVICGLPGSTVFFHIISFSERFKKKVKHKVSVFVFFSAISV